MILLARLLATDNEFNLAFSSKITSEEKYELAKTEFTNLTQEDFLGFLKKLQEVQEKELSQEELEQITGGKGLANKLATAAFLLATVVLPTAMQSTSVEENKFHERLTYLANLDVEQYMIKLNRKIVKGDIANSLDAIEKAMNFWLGPGAFNNEMDKLGITDADLQSARKKSIILKKILIKLNKESEIKNTMNIIV